MQLILGIVLLLFLVLYVIPNIFRYPWHALAFIVAGIALSVVAGGGTRLLAWMNASTHPAVRRVVAAYTAFTNLVHGVPPYNEGKWWIARSLAQAVFWIVMLAAALAVLVALGGVFVWLDQP